MQNINESKEAVMLSPVLAIQLYTIKISNS